VYLPGIKVGRARGTHGGIRGRMVRLEIERRKKEKKKKMLL